MPNISKIPVVIDTKNSTQRSQSVQLKFKLEIEQFYEAEHGRQSLSRYQLCRKKSNFCIKL